MKLRNAAAGLANDPLFADLQPPHLRRADSHLAEAVTALEKADIDAAVAAEEKALGLLRDELTRLDEQVDADGANDRRGRIPAPRGRSSQEPRRRRTARGDLRPAGRRRRCPAKRPDPRQRIDAVGRAKPGQDRGRSGGRRPVGRARRAGEVARGLPPGHRAAARRAPRRAADPAHRRLDRDARDSGVDPRDDPGPGATRLAEIPDGADHGGRPVQERGGAGRAHRALARPGRGDRVRHRPADDAADSFARDAKHRGMAQGGRRGRPHDRPGNARRGRPARACSRRSAGSRPPPRRRRARRSPRTRGNASAS